MSKQIKTKKIIDFFASTICDKMLLRVIHSTEEVEGGINHAATYKNGLIYDAQHVTCKVKDYPWLHNIVRAVRIVIRVLHV